MPKVLIFKNIWIFIIYATDVNENRIHIHVGKKGMNSLCKIWLEPKVIIADKGKLTLKQQNEVKQIAIDYRTELIEQWHKFMNGKPCRVIKIS